MRGLKFLVTGAAGGLGSRVCRELVARGATVIATDKVRDPLGASSRGVVADLASLAEVASLVLPAGADPSNLAETEEGSDYLKSRILSFL